MPASRVRSTPGTGLPAAAVASNTGERRAAGMLRTACSPRRTAARSKVHGNGHSQLCKCVKLQRVLVCPPLHFDPRACGRPRTHVQAPLSLLVMPRDLLRRLLPVPYWAECGLAEAAAMMFVQGKARYGRTEATR
jgi:hypothetical protein